MLISVFLNEVLRSVGSKLHSNCTLLMVSAFYVAYVICGFTFFVNYTFDDTAAVILNKK